MILHDLSAILTWWLYLLAIGSIFYPTTIRIFPSLIDKGYLFSKTVGVVVLSYAVLLLGTTHIFSFSRSNLFMLIAAFSVFNILLIYKSGIDLKSILVNIKEKYKLFLIEEIIFLLTLTSWSLIRTYSPDIHGIEKFMDFSIINSILRTDFFPARDPWFSPLSINYYYFGHLYSAVLIKLTDIPSFISFNLMIGTLFAFIFTGVFSISTNLMNSFIKEKLVVKVKKLSSKIFAAGILASFLLTLSGNLQDIYSFFKPGTKDMIIPFWKLHLSFLTFPNSYWYPTATRFVYHSIHEFPGYALVLSDLHAHILDTPIILLTIAILMQIFTQLKNKKGNKNQTSVLGFKNTIFISFLFAVMYMTNAWDFLIFLLILAIFLVYFQIEKKVSVKKIIRKVLLNLSIILFSFGTFSLPFSLFFKPFVSGIGINCSPAFLTQLGKLGPFLFEKGYCQTTPIWQYAILYGFFIFFGTTFFLYLKRQKKIYLSDKFASLLFLTGLLLTFVPEIIYLKDIYPDYFRANTMFKTAYASFIVLSIASSYFMFRIFGALKNNTRSIKSSLLIFNLLTISFVLFFLVFLYPILAIGSGYNNLEVYKGLDGEQYLATLYPQDFKAINWINKNIKGQPGILEASGDSYTDFGRISSNTGLPNIINWPAHEWLWRGNYLLGIERTREVKTLYETSDSKLAKDLLNKYKVSLIYLGKMEKQKYPTLNESKFLKIGRLIYNDNGVRIYKII